ncbi:Tripeptidyl aminopeptidase precursor [Streptomyces sp. YIM 130001]|uniref:alpha/beta hydrolase n=1 Tax=Streptomyces sp. YIM 130001 TaxID=2259644 RepID=UPI000E64C6BF|nr:alpha/beta hydrolase [Streptomyces sp. YIM 130001]RII17711.1 Tripeptidyl aminopeptidase precursor [Streptomyces sp. YIM 130001]
MTRAPLLYGIAGSVALTALASAPADSLSRPTAPETAGTAAAAARAAAAGIDFGDCPQAEELPPSVECGTVRVPLDYAKPDGRQIELTVSRGRATGDPSDRQGALVYNPGGPGGSGMYFPALADSPEWKRVAAAYDLVGYAPRGVGRSAPLSCQDPGEFAKAPTTAPTHPDKAYKQQRVARAKAYAQGCARNAGDALRHYTTLDNARDLDVLRAALGERRLTFMGASYGTYFGAVYATLFPDHVRRMVFDSAVDPDPQQVWYRNNLDQSVAFERRWADFRAWIARHHTTYALGRTPAQVQRSYDKARDELAREPAGGKVGPGELQAAFLRAGYYDDYWPGRANALAEYLRGRPQELVDIAARPEASAAADENSQAVYTAVECNDASWPTRFETWDRDSTLLSGIAPFATWDNAWMNLPCAFWPAPRQRPVDVRVPEGKLPPTLILSAERDAATPHRGAVELHRRLSGSTLVTERDAGTHGIAFGSNDCVNGHVEAYLLDGKLPGRSAECEAHEGPEPSPGGGSSTGPQEP